MFELLWEEKHSVCQLLCGRCRGKLRLAVCDRWRRRLFQLGISGVLQSENGHVDHAAHRNDDGQKLRGCLRHRQTDLMLAACRELAQLRGLFLVFVAGLRFVRFLLVSKVTVCM